MRIFLICGILSLGVFSAQAAPPNTTEVSQDLATTQCSANQLVLGNGSGNPTVCGGVVPTGDTTSETTPGSGLIGEVQSSIVATQAITSNTPTNITSKSIPAGHWVCVGSVLTHVAGSTVQTLESAGLSTTSVTFPSNAPGLVGQSGTQTAGVAVGLTTGPVYYNFTSPTTVYLVGDIIYTTSTLTIDGALQCQRIF